MPKVRIKVPVAGVDFTWKPGDEVEMSEEDAKAWADGERGEAVQEEAKEPKGK